MSRQITEEALQSAYKPTERRVACSSWGNKNRNPKQSFHTNLPDKIKTLWRYQRVVRPWSNMNLTLWVGVKPLAAMLEHSLAVSGSAEEGHNLRPAVPLVGRPCGEAVSRSWKTVSTVALFLTERRWQSTEEGWNVLCAYCGKLVSREREVNRATWIKTGVFPKGAKSESLCSVTHITFKYTQNSTIHYLWIWTYVVYWKHT